MKLITKSDLIFKLGFLLLASTQDIVPFGSLAAEVNELMEMKEFNEFLLSKRDEILASASKDRVVYKPLRQEDVPAIKSGITVETPLHDEDKARAEARALEFLNAKTVEHTDEHLARYKSLARWFNQEEVMLSTDGNVAGSRFKVNPLELTQDEVVEIVKTYHDPDVAKLRGLVKIDFS